MFGLLSCLLVLMRNIAPGTDGLSQFKAQLLKFPTNDLLTLESAGFPKPWETLPLWKTH